MTERPDVAYSADDGERTMHDHGVFCDDLWRYEPDDAWDGEPDSPEDLADPSCVECGGVGGWMAHVGEGEALQWVMCPCTGEDEDEALDAFLQEREE